MDWTIEKVRKAFNGRLMGNLYMRKMVCQTLLYLPSKIIKQVTQNVWFLSSPEDAWAFTFRGSDIGNQHLVILSDDLFNQDQNQISYTILHEIGHVLLGHKNSMGYEQTQTEIKHQEIEADLFANQYLKTS